MADTVVTADLQVEAPGGGRSLNVADFATPATGAATETTAAAVLARLNAVLSAAVTGTVALDAATLAALESVTATIAGTVPVTGTVALDAATLAALESVSSADAAVLAAVQAADANRNADDDALRGVVSTETTLAGQKANLDFRYSGGKSSVGGTLNTAGANTVITPAAGKRIRVFWVSVIPSSDGSSANLATVALGAQTLYVGYAFAHWEVFTGTANTPLTVSLANGQPVAYTVHYQEI